jgi:hypothetical protein
MPFSSLPDVVYRVTASNNRLNIATASGFIIGTNLAVAPDGRVNAFLTVPDTVCALPPNRVLAYTFDYQFVFNPNGSGSATVEWTYGRDSFCATCTVLDQAVLQRIGNVVSATSVAD